jgi:hypothetical protein
MMLIAHVFAKCEKSPPCEFAHGRGNLGLTLLSLIVLVRLNLHC